MGNESKLGYSKEEQLYYRINRRQFNKVNEILDKYPEMLEMPITKDTKRTLLMQATFNANQLSVEYVLARGANVNTVNSKGETALIIAVVKNKLEIVKQLVAKGADVNYRNPKGLSAIDFAILPGNMPISSYLYSKIQPKDLQQEFEYEEIAKKYEYRYVNYHKFIEALRSEDEKVEPTAYLTKNKIEFSDPVPDPRESWGEWLKRNIDFRDAPMVERESLPPELQPQNRKLGKLDILVYNWTRTDGKKKSHVRPQLNREAMSQMGELSSKKPIHEQCKDYQSAA